MKRVIGVLLASMLISACGGGGGSGGTNSNTSSLATVSSNSSSSSTISNGSSSSIISSNGSSSSVTSSNSCDSEGVIFEECINKSWGVFQVFEENLQSWANETYKEQINNSNVQWKIIDSQAAGHGKVIEVSYGQKDDFGSTFNVSSEDTQNRSAYDTGKLVFDLNVVNFGESYDINKGSAIFELVLTCVWPCTSHSAFIPISVENEWKTIEINIADFIRDGLDTSKIDTVFMLRPLYKNQKNVVFQLDNIKWIKGPTSAPKPNEVYSEHFNTTDSLDRWVFVEYGVNPGIFDKFLPAQGFGMYRHWPTDYDHWAIETSLATAINITNKKASFQLKLADTLVGTTGTPIAFSVAATDVNGNEVESDQLTSLAMVGDQWHQFEISLGSNFPGGFNAANVRKLAIHFYANGKPSYIHGSIHIDTIRITD